MFPGETIRTEIWRDGDVASFRCRVVERDVIAINNGRAEIGSDLTPHAGNREGPSAARTVTVPAIPLR